VDFFSEGRQRFLIVSSGVFGVLLVVAGLMPTQTSFTVLLVPTGAMVEEISRALGIKPVIQWAPMQPGDVQQTAADLTKSGAVLGYAPRTAFPEGIRRFVAWFRESHGRPD